MIIGLTNEQRERLNAAAKAYHEELKSITEDVLKGCETKEDVEMAQAVLEVALNQSCAALKE